MKNEELSDVKGLYVFFLKICFLKVPRKLFLFYIYVNKTNKKVLLYVSTILLSAVVYDFHPIYVGK